jgi:hypothetical protein
MLQGLKRIRKPAGAAGASGSGVANFALQALQVTTGGSASVGVVLAVSQGVPVMEVKH